MSLLDRPRAEIVRAYRTLEEINAVQALEIKDLRERLEKLEAAMRLALSNSDNWDILRAALAGK